MDFLDPKAKRKRAIRLAIGYSLMFVLVVIATIVLVFQAYGYDLDRRGNVVQNGLVFIDSVPDGADIYLNGQKHSRQTNVRLSLAEGQYEMELKKKGYKSWRNTIQLDGGEVKRFYYPLLVPKKLTSRQLELYEKTPDTIWQSPDKRWVLISQPGSVNRFIRYDLNSLGANNVPAKDTVVFPAGLFTTPAKSRNLKLIEWSDDNKNFLVKHSYKGGHEFVVLNHEEPAESKNLDVLFSTDLASVRLRDKKYDQYYIFSKKRNRLSTAELGGEKPKVLLKGVLAYSSHDDDNLLYTRLSPDKQHTRVVLRLGDEEYVLREISDRPEVKVNLASFDGVWYPVFTIAGKKRAYVYENPQNYISNHIGMKPPPIMVLKLHKQPDVLSFSANASKVMINHGREFAVYDIEYDEPYRYTLGKGLNGAHLEWMDGHRLLAQRNGHVLMFDFDGKNQRKLVPNHSSLPAIFDRDQQRLYTVAKDKNNSKNEALRQTNMRLDSDMGGGFF